ncbi:MAG TPA: hypothetical protein K8U92_08700 [Aliarcobacter thereius]|jgi:hypothetical protein|nr:hypothetical protein [Aliarcobacter thereius]HJE03942.1 hypothetical protein [Aliarcobacter thereius]
MNDFIQENKNKKIDVATYLYKKFPNIEEEEFSKIYVKFIIDNNDNLVNIEDRKVSFFDINYAVFYPR